MLLTFCYVTVETMNETVAALYNMTGFFSGEFCRFVCIQPHQCDPNPAFVPWQNHSRHTTLSSS